MPVACRPARQETLAINQAALFAAEAQYDQSQVNLQACTGLPICSFAPQAATKNPPKKQNQQPQQQQQHQNNGAPLLRYTLASVPLARSLQGKRKFNGNAGGNNWKRQHNGGNGGKGGKWKRWGWNN